MCDFNLPRIDWSSSSNSHKGSVLLGSSFIYCIQENALVQHVIHVTHKNNISALVFTNDPSSIPDVNVDVPFSTSNHDRVYFKLAFFSTIFLNNNDKIVTDFSAVDWDSYNEYLRKND